VVTKSGGTVDDSEMVDGMVFDQKASKTAGGPSRMEKAKVRYRGGVSCRGPLLLG
jgi:T-complex protein 1 subunit delta